MFFVVFGHDPAFVQGSEPFPPFTAQPHCIATIPKSCLIVVILACPGDIALAIGFVAVHIPLLA